MNLATKLIALDKETVKRILIVGDGVRDIYIHGQFGECQEDCYKFMEESRVEVPGGAANAEMSISKWKALVTCFCHTRPIKTRFIVNGKYVFRHDDDGPRPKPLTMELIELNDYDAVLISDYDKGFLTAEFIRELISLANAKGLPIVADAKREPTLYQGAILKCNYAYANNYPVRAMCDYGVVITHGQKSPWCNKGDAMHVGTTLYPFPRFSVKCKNHVGAGDCFAAHLVLALAHGFSLEDAAAVAHSAGRVYVQHEHNRPPMPSEIEADMEN